jgi:hypothetical protein
LIKLNHQVSGWGSSAGCTAINLLRVIASPAAGGVNIFRSRNFLTWTIGAAPFLSGIYSEILAESLGDLI